MVDLVRKTLITDIPRSKLMSTVELTKPHKEHGFLISMELCFNPKLCQCETKKTKTNEDDFDNP